MGEQEFVPSKINPWLIAVIVSLAAFMEVLDTSIAAVALPYICGSLGASLDEGNWILTSYLVSNAVVLPAGSWASSVLGRKNFFLLCIALFTVSSFLCGVAPSLVLLLVFRIFQGAGGGGLIPVAQAIIADSFPPAKRSLAFAFFGIVVVLAPSIGPTLGGWITDTFSWRWIFFINVPVGLLALLLNYRLLEDPPTSKGDRRNFYKLDYIGFGLLTVSMGALQVWFDKAEEKNWFGSTYIVVFASIFAVSFLSLIVWEWKHADPLINVKLLKHGNFAISCTMMILLGAVLNAGTTLLPLLEQTYFRYTATLAGLSVTAAGVSLIALFTLAGALSQKLQARHITAIGFFLMAIGFYASSHMIGPQTSFGTFSLARFYQIAGIAFLFTSITSVVYIGMPGDQGNQISGITNLVRNIGGSIGISLANAAVTERAQFHRSHLVGNLAASDRTLHNTLLGTSQSLIHSGYDPVRAMRMAMGQIETMLELQAHILAYDEVYFVIAVVSATAVCGTFFLAGNKPGEGEAHGH